MTSTTRTPALSVEDAHAQATAFLEARRLRHGAATMDATDGGGGAGDTGSGDTGSGDTGSSAGRSFTEADVERIVTSRLERERQAAERRTQAATATERERLANLERELETERTARRRVTIANRHGLGDLEDLLGGGTDEEIEGRAKRLAERLKVGASNSSSSSSSSSSSTRQARTRTARTITESGGSGQGLTKKEQAVEALRSLSGRRASDD